MSQWRLYNSWIIFYYTFSALLSNKYYTCLNPGWIRTHISIGEAFRLHKRFLYYFNCPQFPIFFQPHFCINICNFVIVLNQIIFVLIKFILFTDAILKDAILKRRHLEFITCCPRNRKELVRGFPTQGLDRDQTHTRGLSQLYSKQTVELYGRFLLRGTRGRHFNKFLSFWHFIFDWKPKSLYKLDIQLIVFTATVFFLHFYFKFFIIGVSQLSSYSTVLWVPLCV